MTGNELARTALRLRPGLPALLTSGYEHPLVKDSDAVKFPLLRKPYRREQLAAAIRAALDGARS